ncbi:MAG: hypothetical protein ACRDHZ_00050 [Ktedonobacteraceae bacterium]
MEFTYEQIKQLAKETGRKVTDLIALASQNDPFYQGTPSQKELAEWFAEIYYSHGWNRGQTHLRRCHYQIVSLQLNWPDGKPYENTEQAWDRLGLAAKAARYLHLVEMSAFEDKKNAEPINHMPSLHEPDLSVDGYVYLSDIQVPEFPSLPKYLLNDYQANQPYHLEIWCEKTTINDILEPLCREYGMVLQTASGEQSIVAAHLLSERLQQYQKPARVLYISDFDPAGKSMPVAVARKLEWFVREHIGEDADVRLFPVILTEEQVTSYRLPRTPIKATERRKAAFEARFGQDAVELDALEALHPGELERVMRSYIERYYDPTLASRTRSARADLENAIRQAQHNILTTHQQEIEEARQELAEITAEFGPRMEAYAERIQNLWQAISGEMEEDMPDLTNYPTAEPREADELSEGLYNSRRDYIDQIEAYKLFQGKVTDIDTDL